MKNTLKELRKQANLTQLKASNLFHVSLRTYITYENDISKINTITYQYMLNEFEKMLLVDEMHGILTIDKIQNICNEVFNTSSIRYCYLFGDYAKNCANEKSPVKLLISSRLTGPAYFNMIETIRKNIVKKTEIYTVDRLLYNKEIIEEILKNGLKISG